MAENTNEKTNGGTAGYDFAAHERPLFEAWKDAGYFQRTPGFGPRANDPFTVVIPPPNITGVLHMGHALNETIQDTCIRRARMQGRPTRWEPTMPASPRRPRWTRRLPKRASPVWR